MFLGEKIIPCIPLFTRFHILVGRNVSDMKTPVEQLNFGLGLVIPVTASPWPWVAGCSYFRNYHDAPSLPIRRVPDSTSFIFRWFKRDDCQCFGIHYKIIAVETMPRCLLSGERSWSVLHWLSCSADTSKDTKYADSDNLSKYVPCPHPYMWISCILDQICPNFHFYN